MKINIGNNNEIKKSNIGQKNSNKNLEGNNFLKIILEIIIGVLITVIGGYILFILKWN